MRMIDIIHKKREGFHLDPAEIEYFVKGYADGSVPDYQASALMMAIFFNGMKEDELSHLVQAMVDSGDTIDLSDIQGVKVDKHSTGGVGDKTSLVVGPLVASVGVPVAKMSGRGLGHTGGTLDKLESIKGFKVELTRDEFVDNVNNIKLALAGQTGNLVPADKLMYALRDVTATVDSIPLIASSIMSKKIASGADAIVLDVKTGSGAFMKSLDAAKTLAETMVRIGERLHRKTIAVISDMNQPLGHEIGNANEIREVIATLKGEGPNDLLTLSLTLASHMTVLGGIYNTVEEARTALEEKINDGTAFEKFKTFIEAQGGDLESLDNVTADYQFEVKAGKDGYLKKVNSELIGTAAMLLGAGRKEKGDPIDHAVGITMHKKIGESVSEDDILFTLHANSKDVEDAIATLQRSFEITEHDVSSHELIYEIVK